MARDLTGKKETAQRRAPPHSPLFAPRAILHHPRLARPSYRLPPATRASLLPSSARDPRVPLAIPYLRPPCPSRCPVPPFAFVCFPRPACPCSRSFFVLLLARFPDELCLPLGSPLALPLPLLPSLSSFSFPPFPRLCSPFPRCPASRLSARRPAGPRPRPAFRAFAQNRRLAPLLRAPSASSPPPTLHPLRAHRARASLLRPCPVAPAVPRFRLFFHPQPPPSLPHRALPASPRRPTRAVLQPRWHRRPARATCTSSRPHRSPAAPQLAPTHAPRAAPLAPAPLHPFPPFPFPSRRSPPSLPRPPTLSAPLPRPRPSLPSLRPVFLSFAGHPPVCPLSALPSVLQHPRRPEGVPSFLSFDMPVPALSMRPFSICFSCSHAKERRRSRRGAEEGGKGRPWDCAARTSCGGHAAVGQRGCATAREETTRERRGAQNDATVGKSPCVCPSRRFGSFCPLLVPSPPALPATPHDDSVRRSWRPSEDPRAARSCPSHLLRPASFPYPTPPLAGR